ncbi:rod shape-determining protein MreC [Anaeromassilibacillus sp. SJQ-5]
MKDFLKSFAFKVLGVIALILVGVMIYGASTGGLATIPATIAGAIITPLQSAVTSVSDGISGFFGQFGSSKETREELEQAQKELRELREQVVDYDKMKEENEWYAKILGLHEQHSDYTFASGKVIAVDPLSPFGNFTINAGTKSGIAVGDPVITAEGLVGLVSEVSFTSCKVRTILDVNTKASAMISRNGNTAITGGAPPLAEKGLLRLNTLEKSSGAAIGDIVVTSGRGGVFPEGLLIGKITEVNPESDGLSLYAIIEPYVDVRSLKNVMVITSFDGQGEGG